MTDNAEREYLGDNWHLQELVKGRLWEITHLEGTEDDESVFVKMGDVHLDQFHACEHCPPRYRARYTPDPYQEFPDFISMHGTYADPYQAYYDIGLICYLNEVRRSTRKDA